MARAPSWRLSADRSGKCSRTGKEEEGATITTMEEIIAQEAQTIIRLSGNLQGPSDDVLIIKASAENILKTLEEGDPS